MNVGREHDLWRIAVAAYARRGRGRVGAGGEAGELAGRPYFIVETWNTVLLMRRITTK